MNRGMKKGNPRRKERNWSRRKGRALQRDPNGLSVRAHAEDLPGRKK